MKTVAVALAALLSIFAVAGCGGSDDEKAAAKPKPTAVALADLDKDGNFWLALTPDLKDELVELGKSRLGEQRPGGATGIRAVPTADLVAEIEKQYANQSKRSATIYATYTGANDKIAGARLDDALSGLEQLCSEEPPPPECGDEGPP